MIKLAKREEQIMDAFWDLKQAYIRDIIPLLPDPKPHYNTVATMVKILEEKGFLRREMVGNIFCYYPLISQDDYQKHAMKDIVSKYFGNSYPRMLAFFAKEQNLSKQDLEEVLKVINKIEEP